MAIRTDIATHYFWRQMITAIVCLVFAVWGGYDLWVKIPAQEIAFTDFNDGMKRLEGLQIKVDTGGGPLNEQEQAAYERLENAKLSPPSKPSTFDKLVQWMFISCILYVPWCLWSIRSLQTKRFELDDEGNLKLPGGAEWKSQEISGIDMSRWMAKSIAHVTHENGNRTKMDAYLRKNLELIVGGIAHRFDAEHWNNDGTEVKADDDDADALDTDTESSSEDDAPATDHAEEVAAERQSD